jgi:hypothetical protein
MLGSNYENEIKNALDKVVQQIYFCKLKVSFVAQEKVILPIYKGSTFRGCLDDAFRNEMNKCHGKNCEECKWLFTCPLAILYSTPLLAGHNLRGKFTHPPRPYLIVPMPGQQTIFEEGSEFWFDLILIGSVIKFLPLLISVFLRMGLLGIGTGRGKFQPVKLEHFVPGQGYKELPSFAAPYSICFKNIEIPHLTNEVTLCFEHPVRILSDKKPVKNPPSFSTLIDSLARRASLLAYLYCGSVWVNTDRVFELNETVQILSNSMQWQNWERYSGRQNKYLSFDGNVDLITYKGSIAPWASLLTLGSWIQAASTTTFGLGKYSILPDE